jgi:hypothetical protein
MEVRRITREAAEQRHLADKAEASRFTELREFLRAELLAVAVRDAELSDKLIQKVDQAQSALGETIEHTGNGLGASLGELEDRFVRQFPASNERS